MTENNLNVQTSAKSTVNWALIGQIASTAVNKTSTALKWTKDNISQQIPKNNQKIKTIAKQVGGITSNTVNKVSSYIGPALKSTKDNISQNIPKNKQKIKTVVKQVGGITVNAFNKVSSFVGPAFRSTKDNINENISENNSKETQISKNNSNAIEIAKQAGKGAAIGGGAAITVTVISSYIIPALGWTASGVALGSKAAVIQSGIGVVAAGSKFAFLQSTGALGLGIFGTAAFPVIIGTGIVTGVCFGGYKYWKGKQKVEMI